MTETVKSCHACPALKVSHANYMVCALGPQPHRELVEAERDAIRAAGAHGGRPYFPAWCPLTQGPITLQAVQGPIGPWLPRYFPGAGSGFCRVDAAGVTRAEVYPDGRYWAYRVFGNGARSKGTKGDDAVAAARFANAVLRLNGDIEDDDVPCVDAACL